MNHARTSPGKFLRPALAALPFIAILACESAQPLAVESPKFSADSTTYSAYAGELYNVHFITIDVTNRSLKTGEQAQASGMPRTVEGTEVPQAPISWDIEPKSVATISETGVITGGSTTGTATVYATSDGVTRSTTISNTATNTSTASAPPHMISITSNASTIKLGEKAQVSGIVRDVTGTPVTGVPITWTTSPTEVATATTLNSTQGEITGRGVGTATVYAKADTVTRQITITVIDSGTTTSAKPPAEVPSGATGGSYGSATAAELPRASVSTNYPSTSRQVRVPANANLQDYLTAAQPGDELLLPPGATYVGNFWLPNKGANAPWIVIRTELSDGAIGSPGTRMTPSRAASANLAKILTNTVSPAVISSLGANHYRLTGIEFGATSDVSTLSTIVTFGSAEYEQNTTESIASNLVLDRSYVHGSNSLQLRRCVALNSATSAVLDSWLGECHSNLNDSQALAGWNGPGPFLIQNNHLEAGAEIILFGGGSATIQNLSPSDVTIRGNHIMRPASWKGVWAAKNLIEVKHAKRMLVEGNVIENNWYDQQAGFAFVLKSENQNSDNPWTQTSDITIRYNRIRNTGNVFNLAGNPSDKQAIPATRFVISDNIVENVNVSPFNADGHTLQLLANLSDVVMMHNTVVSANGGNSFAVVFGELPGAQRLVIHSNVQAHGAYGMKGGGVGEGTPSITNYAPGALVTNNAIVGGGSASTYPANNYFPGSLSEMGFANLSGGDYRISGGSQYSGKGYDGRDIGADINQVESMTRNAVVAP